MADERAFTKGDKSALIVYSALYLDSLLSSRGQGSDARSLVRFLTPEDIMTNISGFQGGLSEYLDRLEEAGRIRRGTDGKFFLTADGVRAYSSLMDRELRSR
jgi:hypothetical protein